MATVDQIKNGLVEKILSINDKEILEALDKFLSNSTTPEIVQLTEAQKKMLEMSELDIKEGRLISQDAMIERNLEWLKES